MRMPRVVAMWRTLSVGPARSHFNHPSNRPSGAPTRRRRVAHRAARLAAAVGLLLTAATGACASGSGSVAVERAVIVAGNGLLPPTLYFTARNGGTVADTLVGAEVDGASRVTFARHRDHAFDATDPDTSADAAQVRVERVPLDAGTRVDFDPNGTFAIITPSARPLVAGDSARVTVRFAHAPPAGLHVRVVEYAQLDSALSAAVASGFPRWFVKLFNATPGAPDSVRNPKATVQAGRDLFASNGCISCHGLNGYGDGPVGATLNPPPRDFRAAGAFRTGLDERAIAQTIATGITNGGSMPRYPHLSEMQRRSLALYVLSLARPNSSPTTLP